MLLDNDVVASGKPKPSAFAGGIRCKERVEVFSLTSGGISDAVVTKSLGSESEGTAWWRTQSISNLSQHPKFPDVRESAGNFCNLQGI
jgi:hypothetical protein